VPAIQREFNKIKVDQGGSSLFAQAPNLTSIKNQKSKPAHDCARHAKSLPASPFAHSSTGSPVKSPSRKVFPSSILHPLFSLVVLAAAAAPPRFRGAGFTKFHQVAANFT
jgi:hypothetical protein